MSRTRAEDAWLELVADLLHGCSAELPAERIALQLCATFELSGCAFNDVPADGPYAMTLWPLDAGMGGLRDELTEWTLTRAVAEHAADLRLTPREQAVLGLLAEGGTAAAIARRLMISERTVHKHLEHVYAKLGVSDRLSAVVRAELLGVLPPGPAYAVVRIPPSPVVT